ncbi:armadillo-type protein [Lipomyces oligophaga]|uniref:armadillo-type protein n=1 Tax=Lipomyces oligophaga TaxID=45792 RepID=UPI0034CD2B6F
MDVNGLHQCFASTLDSNPNLRKQAELQLNEASRAPGFITACLDIVLAQPFGTVQISAAVFLKNKIIRNWEFEDLNKSPIAENEKPAFRERLIPAILSASPHTQQHLISILNKVVSYDYPEKWPEFLDLMIQLLHSQEAQHIHTGLICLAEITKAYKWRNKEGRDPLNRIIDLAFPVTVQIGSNILSENSTVAGDMMRLIMKSYHAAIYLELAPRLQEQSFLLPWGNLMLQVVAKEIPADIAPQDDDEKTQFPWWKAKKWAFRNLNRLFSRYGDPGSLTKAMKDYSSFAKNFAVNFAPEILRAYLHQIDLWANKQLWLSAPVLNLIMTYCELSVKPKITWEILRPHVDVLVSHVIFPLICLSDDDIDMFENEPVEYIHRRLDYFDENPSPDIMAINFLVSVAERRRKATFNGILHFINGIVANQQQNPTDEVQARQKEGALRMIGALSHVILGKKSPVAEMMEQFFVSYIFSDFQSSYGYLRVRACEVVNRFAEADFKDPNNMVFIYQSVTTCLHDKYLPVQVEAALALQPLARNDSIRNALSQNIKPLMGILMELSKKVDMDQIMGVMEDFVDMFSEQLAPFAVELAEQLRDQFLRMLSDMIEKQNSDPDQYDTDYGDFTILGILNTLTTLLLSLDNAPDLVLQLEHAILPVVTAVLEHEQTEFYSEVFELVDSSSYTLRRITPGMWNLLGLLHQSFKTSGLDYFDDLLPCLESYVIYGTDELRVNPNYVATMVDFVNTIFENDDRIGMLFRQDACRLIQTLLLNLKPELGERACLDDYIQYFVDLTLNRLSVKDGQEDLKQNSYLVSILEIIINCMYYNPRLAFIALESRGQAGNFFDLWFNNIPKLTRVHDKRLSIMAILSIIMMQPNEVPESIRSGIPQFLHGLVLLLQTLPDALQKRETMMKEFSVDDQNVYSDYMMNPNTGDWDDEPDEGGEFEEDEEDEGGEQVDDGTNKYVDFLSNEAVRLGQESLDFLDSDFADEMLEEEPLYQSPLDKVNLYIVVKDVFLAIQQDSARSGILAGLNDQQRSVIESAIQNAYKEEADQAAKTHEVQTNTMP